MLNLSPVNLLLTVLNLLVLLFLMKIFLYKPVLNVIEKRRQLIEQQFSRADMAQKEAEQLKTEYEGCLADAKKLQQEKILEAQTQARNEYDKILSEADAKAQKIVAEAKKAGQEEYEKTLRQAQAQIAGLAVAAAARIVTEAQGEASDKAAYDAFLKKVSTPEEGNKSGHHV